MAQSRLLAVTDRQRVRPLTLQGQAVIEGRPQIAERLASSLSEAHAALFAEPSRDDAHARIEWYTGVAGPLRQLINLGAPEQEQARSDLARLIADVDSMVGELRLSRDGGERLLAELIALALQGPGDEHVFVVGNQPVLVAWGMAQLDRNADQPQLTRFVVDRRSISAPNAPATAPANMNRSRGGGASGRPDVTAPVAVSQSERPLKPILPWLLPLVGSLALLVLATWLLPLWAPPVLAVLMPPNSIYELPTQQSRDLAMLDEGVNEEARLRRQLTELQAQIAGRRANCEGSLATTDPGRGPVAQPAIPNASINERTQRERAGQGEVQVTLAWNGDVDLDLLIRCPGGEVISHQQRAACGGQLDVDMNCHGMSCRRTHDPVENIFWRTGIAPSGAYSIFVSNYDNGPPADFLVRVLVRGTEKTFRGSAMQREPAKIGEFHVP